ncbi:MAG: Minf_1886 family protein [Akkermansiaceae bacterium]
MQPIQLENAIAEIVQVESRFAPGAYFLVREALDFTVDRMAEENGGEKRHVSGPELLIGFRDYALQEYGPMAATLLEDWGLTECKNIGEIVFLFIEHGVFGKQDSDTIEDFRNIYDFKTEFTAPFLPKDKSSAA